MAKLVYSQWKDFENKCGFGKSMYEFLEHIRIYFSKRNSIPLGATSRIIWIFFNETKHFSYIIAVLYLYMTLFQWRCPFCQYLSWIQSPNITGLEFKQHIHVRALFPNIKCRQELWVPWMRTFVTMVCGVTINYPSLVIKIFFLLPLKCRTIAHVNQITINHLFLMSKPGLLETAS